MVCTYWTQSAAWAISRWRLGVIPLNGAMSCMGYKLHSRNSCSYYLHQFVPNEDTVIPDTFDRKFLRKIW